MRFAVWTGIGIVLLSAVVVPLFADQPTTAPAAYATPADVFNAAVKAGREGDFPTFTACLSPDAKDQYVRFFLTMLVSSPDTGPATRPADPALTQFLAKYGITDLSPKPGETDKQAGQRLADAVKDKTGFLTDLGRHEMAQRKGPDTSPMPELTDAQIAPDGKTATGKSVSHQADGAVLSQEVKFQKIDGSWLIDTIIAF